MSTLLKNAFVIDPYQNIFEEKHVWIENGLIKDLLDLNHSLPQVQETLDLKGAYLAPGLIDLHVHFREPGQTHKEDMETGSKASVKGGFTSVCPMPNTYPVNDDIEITNLMLDRAKAIDLCRIFPVGAVSKNLLSREMSDIEALAKAGCVAFSDDGRPVENTELLREALFRVKDLGMCLMEHCEELSLSKYATIHRGEVSRDLGLEGIPLTAETADVARLISLAMETKAHVHLSHLSCADSVTFLERVQADVHITAEVTPHHLVLTDESIRELGTSGKMYPPLRTQKDCDAMIYGLASGLVQAVATDHAPHTEKEKSVAFKNAPNGVIGLETSLPIMLTLVKKGALSLSQMISVMSLNPATIIKKKELGHLSKNTPADLVVFEAESIRDFSDHEFVSKSQNTPFRNTKGMGEVLYTFVAGRKVYQKDGL